METIKVYEDWNEREDGVYYRWRLIGENEWHEKLTALKQKPTWHTRYMTQFEFDEFRKKFEGEEVKDE